MTVLDQVPLERISAQARQVNIGRLLLTILAGFFYALGWVAAKIVLAVVWAGIAVKVGFLEGRKTAASGSRGLTG